MNVGQIQQVVRRHPNLKQHTRGFYDSEHLPAILIPGGYIVNYKAKHWFCLFVTPEGALEFMCSLGKTPGQYGLRFSNCPITVNAVKLQSPGSSLCGGYVIFYLYYRTLGLDMETILHFFTSDTTQNDDKIVQFLGTI